MLYSCNSKRTAMQKYKTTVYLTLFNEEHPGAQIDLLIDRNDNVINLCEMKFSDTEYSIGKEEAAKLRQRKAVFKSVTRTKKAVHLTMVTTYGVRHNAYWNDIQSEITMKDLFSR